MFEQCVHREGCGGVGRADGGRDVEVVDCLVKRTPAGGCDETCAAYVLVELEDNTGNIIEGYDRASFNPIINQSAINIPLLWNNSSRLPLGHGNVTVKLWFRAAKVYAVYLGESFDPV